MADEIVVPERCLVYLPSNVDVKDACLIEPMAVAVRSMLYLWNGWAADCAMFAQEAPEEE